jgi:hypothetical protein
MMMMVKMMGLMTLFSVSLVHTGVTNDASKTCECTPATLPEKHTKQVWFPSNFHGILSRFSYFPDFLVTPCSSAFPLGSL